MVSALLRNSCCLEVYTSSRYLQASGLTENSSTNIPIDVSMFRIPMEYLYDIDYVIYIYIYLLNIPIVDSKWYQMVYV